MAITFNDRLKNIARMLVFDASAGTGQQLGAGNIYNVDIFPDTADVGDWVAFGFDHNDGKCNELRINIGTALAATSITGVWEYISGGTYPAPVWSALSGVADGTNSFQNTGAQTVSFTIPTDWENFHYPNSISTSYYQWYIRFRITAITGITEGGKLANITNSLQGLVYAINVSGYGSGTPATFTDIYNADVAGGWGVVSQDQRCFGFECNLWCADNSYLETYNELIQFGNNWYITSTPLTILLAGEVVSGDKVKNGSTFIFIGTNANYPSGGFGPTGSNSLIYSTQFKHVVLDKTAGFNGYWGGNLGNNSGQKLIDVMFIGFRQVKFTHVQNTFIGLTCIGDDGGQSACEIPGGIIKSCKWFGGNYALRFYGSNSGNHIHECDMSEVLQYPINPWEVQNVDNVEFFAVDCNFGSFADTNKVKWKIRNPATYQNGKVYETYSMLIRALDKDGNGISGATLVVKDKDGNEVINITSNDDGYFGVDYGTTTGVAATYIQDSSKSWTAGQYHYKEFILTSGAGIGQRRIIGYNHPTTQLNCAWDFDTTPTIGDRYAIIPYLNVKEFSAIAYTPGSEQWSSVVDLNPFTIEIKKSGYKKYTSELDIDKRVDWTIKLEKVLDNNFSKLVTINSQ